MRAFLLTVLIAAAAGCGLGVAMAFVSAGSGGSKAFVETLDDASPAAAAAPPGVETPARRGPRAEVDEPVFNFGTMQRGATQKHTFVVKNTGDAPLRVQVGQTSCKCTLGEVDGAPVPPGGTTSATLEWTARALPGQFRQTAQLRVSPTGETIVLTVEGEVVDAAGLEPREFSIGRMTVDEQRQLSVVFMAFDREDLELTTEPPQREGVEGAYQVSAVRLEPGELPDPKAKAGYRINLVAGPNLPIGALNDWVTVRTNVPEADSLQVPVFGRVEGDLSIRGSGAGWNPDTGVLGLGVIQSAVGKKVRLIVSIKGPHAAAAELQIAEVDPPELLVSLGEARQVREGLVHVPLTVEAPAGMRPMVRLNNGRKPDGTYEFPQGLIRITSTLPNASEILLNPRFTVQ